MAKYTFKEGGKTYRFEADSVEEADAIVGELLGESTPTAPAPASTAPTAAPIPAPATTAVAPTPVTPPGMPPQKQFRLPMGFGEGVQTGASNQLAMGWGDEALRAIGAVDLGDRMESEFKRAQQEAPVGTFVGQILGGLASGYPLVKGAQWLGLGGTAVKNAIGAGVTSAAESVITTAGEAQPGERTKDLGMAAALGGGLGVASYPAAALASKAIGFAGKALPGVRRLAKEEAAYERMGAAARASGVDPEKLKLELGQLGEAGVLADLQHPQLKGLGLEAMTARQMPIEDIQQQVNLRGRQTAGRVAEDFTGKIQTPTRSVIAEANATGLTDYDVPLADFNSLKALSGDLMTKSKANFDRAIYDTQVIGIDPSTGRPITQKVQKHLAIPTETEDFLQKNPLGIQAFKQAHDYLRMTDPNINIVDQAGNYSLEFLDAVKNELNTIARQAATAGDQSYKAIIQQKKAFQDTIMNLPGNETYADAIKGVALSRKLDNAATFGHNLATKVLPSDTASLTNKIAAMSPMERNATVVSFMDGIVSNVGKMKPTSSIETAFKLSEAHEQAFNQLVTDPSTGQNMAGIAFDDILELVKREKLFKETARVANRPKYELEKQQNENLMGSVVRATAMPSKANVVTLALNALGRLNHKGMDPTTARTIASTLFKTDIDEDTWKLIQQGFNKQGSLRKFKQTLAQNMAASVSTASEEEIGDFAMKTGGWF